MGDPHKAAWQFCGGPHSGAAPTKPGELAQLGHKTRACPDGEAHGARAWQYSNHELIDFTGEGCWSRSQKRDTTQRACLRVMPSGAAVIFDSLVGHDIIGADWQARQDEHRKVAGLTCVQLAAWEEKTGAAAAARHHTLFGLCSLIRDAVGCTHVGLTCRGLCKSALCRAGLAYPVSEMATVDEMHAAWCACQMWLARGGTSVQDKGQASRRGEWPSRR